MFRLRGQQKASKYWVLSDLNALPCDGMKNKFGEIASEFMPVPKFIVFYGLTVVTLALPLRSWLSDISVILCLFAFFLV